MSGDGERRKTRTDWSDLEGKDAKLRVPELASGDHLRKANGTALADDGNGGRSGSL
jgi:hypothetical protein